MDRYQSRLKRLRSAMKKAGVPALLVSNVSNVTYLTGFTGDSSYLWVGPGEEVLISDGRYTTQLEDECPGLRVHLRKVGQPMSAAAGEVLTTVKATEVGFESATMTVAVRDALEKRLPKVAFKPVADLVETLRQVKDKEEIAAIRTAIEQAERAFKLIQAGVSGDFTEKRLADELEMALRRFGATCSSFPPIIAAGPRAALPHARATDAPIAGHELVLIDWGARNGLYVSDLTRVWVTAKISPKLERVYRVVSEAHRAAIAAIRPGVTAKQIDAVARGVIHEAGFGAHFTHGLGHGIGLEVHEEPRLSATNEQPLVPGMVLTIEPGIYLPGWGGIRLEDDVLVTKTGAETLSTLPKSLEAMTVQL
jgi:Xaa-Pro aminopeptidase